MRLRPRQAQGTIPWEGDVYGRSHLGTPLVVWHPAGPCELLVFAAASLAGVFMTRDLTLVALLLSSGFFFACGFGLRRYGFFNGGSWLAGGGTGQTGHPVLPA